MNHELYTVRLEIQVARQWGIQGDYDRAMLHIEFAQKYLEEIIDKIEAEPKAPPLRYWQHDETGRVCAKVLQPGERWYEITQELYKRISYE